MTEISLANGLVIIRPSANAPQMVIIQQGPPGGGAGGGGVTDGDKGDITVSGGGAIWTLDATAGALVGAISTHVAAADPHPQYLTSAEAAAGFAAILHTHVIADVTGLQSALDAKQPAGSYAAAVHAHVIADVTGLQAALDGKQPAGSYAPLSHVGSGGTAHADVTAGGASGFMTGADKTKLNGIAAGATANATDAQLRDRSTHTGTQAASTISDFSTAADARITNAIGVTVAAFAHGHANAVAGVSAGYMSAADKTKLDSIAAGATANATDAQLRDRSTHTGAQAASTISDLTESVQDIMGATLVAGANVTVNYDDGAGTVTIAASGGGGGGSPGGASTQIQFNSGGTFGGSSGLTWDDATKTLGVNDPTSSVQLTGVSGLPSTPPAGKLKLFAQSLGRMMLRMIGPSGLDVTLQPHLTRNKVARWNPPGNAATAPGVDGAAAMTALGTATARNVAVTNRVTRSRRLGYVSAATAAAFAGQYLIVAQYTIGTGSGDGGFHLIVRFVPSDAATVAGARMFVGMRNLVGAPANSEPNTLTNHIGVAGLSSSANLHIVYGGSAAQTAIDLGANFPAHGLSTDLYELTLYAAPNSSDVIYRVERLNTGHVAEGTLTGAAGVALPANSTLLSPAFYRTNNATLLAVGLDLVSWSIETDF